MNVVKEIVRGSASTNRGFHALIQTISIYVFAFPKREDPIIQSCSLVSRFSPVSGFRGIEGARLTLLYSPPYTFAIVLDSNLDYG